MVVRLLFFLMVSCLERIMQNLISKRNSLASLMLTFSISNIIYTQILLPLKKEKLYLIAVAGAAALNAILSLLFGTVVFKDNPAFGVALGTAITDLLLVTTLFALSWNNSKHILLNINNLKILVLGFIIGVAAYFISPALVNALSSNMTLEVAYILDIVIVFFGSAAIYVAGLIFTKEKLTMTIIHK